MQMKPAFKAILIVLAMGVLYGGYLGAKKAGWIEKIVPAGRQTSSILDEDTKKAVKSGETPLIRVGVVTWGGYAGGQYFNGGFKPSKESRYFKEYGILVEFLVLDDFEASRKAWISDNVDLLWVTADAYPAETKAFVDAGYNPQLIFQADWSRGGDAIVAKYGINNVNDLKGKKVSVALGTPSNTFLLLTLAASGLEWNDIQVVGVPSAIDSASRFKSGAVDAAVVWSPDDADCVRSVSGSKILTSTRTATHIIADGFFAKKSFVEKNQKALVALVEGWMRGAAEINTNPEAKEKAIKILMQGLNIDEALARSSIGNVRLTTYGDNVNFFNLRGNYAGVKGEDLYTKMARLYHAINIAPADVPLWRNVVNTSILQQVDVNKLSDPEHAAEGGFTFSKPTEAQATAPALTSKALTVVFATGSSTLDENAKMIIEMGFADVARQFASARIRIEGNTDSVGSYESNKRLSLRRAQTVADFLVDKYSFDPNRFVIVGNGPDNPIAGNDTTEGRARNRRTDFELLGN